MTDQKPDPVEMESALKVISTWASVPGALDAKHVRNLCDKALRRRPLDQVHQMLQDEARGGNGGSQQIARAETITALMRPGAEVPCASVSYVESDAVTFGFEEPKP
jgi:ABC-type phosphate transport system ATPase subunit